MIYDTLPLAKGAALELMVMVMSHYTEPHRKFHTLKHLEQLFWFKNWFKVKQKSEPGWLNDDLLSLAILFHDIVYVPGATDNESLSAELGAAFLRRNDFRPSSVDLVSRIILATKTHEMQDSYTMDPLVALFLDMDLAGLGSSNEEYIKTSRLIVEEYAPVVGEKALWEGRAAWIKGMLARKTIYQHPEFIEAFEGKARFNLELELTCIELIKEKEGIKWN